MRCILWAEECGAHELGCALEYVDAHADETLWMCCLLCFHAAAAAGIARATVADAKRSEQDGVKLDALMAQLEELCNIDLIESSEFFHHKPYEQEGPEIRGEL